jgi:hypothetical protein
MSSVLAERAAYEGPRSTRAVEDNQRPPPGERVASELGRIIHIPTGDPNQASPL